MTSLLTIPSWAILGVVIALLQSLRPLAQERYKAKAFAVAIGNKIVIAVVSLPFVIWHGLPDNPLFYAGLAITSVIWCVSDIAYFHAVEKHGAGTISRILPGAIIVSFLLWFAIDPSLFSSYMERPWLSLGIAACIFMAAYCSMHLSRCHVSRSAFRLLWPTFAAATVGPIMMKLILQTAPANQTAFAYAFVESLIMLAYWSLYVTAQRWLSGNRAQTGLVRLQARDLIEPAAVKVSLAIGLIMTAVIAIRSTALLTVDNPAYVTVLGHTDVLWIILIYKLAGKRDESNVRAGLGMVACAALLVLLKSLN